jgi:hypothetical protein
MKSGWGAINHSRAQNGCSCNHLVEYGLAIYRQKYRHFTRVVMNAGERWQTDPWPELFIEGLLETKRL